MMQNTFPERIGKCVGDIVFGTVAAVSGFVILVSGEVSQLWWWFFGIIPFLLGICLAYHSWNELNRELEFIEKEMLYRNTVIMNSKQKR